MAWARSKREFLTKLPEATSAIVWSFDAAWFARAPKLRLLATPAAGRELLPQEAPKGVRIHFGGFHGRLIRESVLGFMLAWARGFFRVERRKSGWPRRWLSDKCYTLDGTKAVVVGYGRIGRSLGAALEAFGVEVKGFTHANLGDLPKAAKEADWFILTLPSGEETANFLDARLLARLPRRCVVINVGRGSTIDEAALVAALKAQRIAGAYLDVCQRETSEIWSKAVVRGANRRLIDPANPARIRNLVLMPHAAAFSPDYIELTFKELADEGLV